MNQILEHLKTIDAVEEQQRVTGCLISEFPEVKSYLKHNTGVLKLSGPLSRDNRDMVIKKHNRFAPYPSHTHEFMELNYMMSGSCKQIINGKEVELKKHQILIMDSNSTHELMPLGEDDILINIYLRTADIKIDVLKKIATPTGGPTYDFLMNSILGKDYRKSYLILDIHEDRPIQITLEQMIWESLSVQHLTAETLSAYFHLLFLQLSRLYHQQIAQVYGMVPKANIVLRILQEIEQNYKDITLSSLAEKLGYNKNYLSDLIKHEIGRTFKDLVTASRLQEARRLLGSTKLSIEQISTYSGFSNKTQFYKKFNEYYNMSPGMVREQG